MARRTATSYRSGKTAPAGQTPEGQEAEAAPAAAADGKKGLTFVDALSITTTLLLLAAILMTDYYLGKRYGTGVFFAS
jgi:hypothetical protein